MLSRGCAPWLPCWPIVEIKLQGKIAGYDTDDCIVFVEDQESKARRKLLCQIKHTIAITTGSKKFGEVMQAAWNDYSKSTFKKKQDQIALITGPIAATDFQGIDWLLGQARHSKDAAEFFWNVQKAKFSSEIKRNKLEVLKTHLTNCNNGSNVSDEALYDFLKHFHLLGYDVGTEGGVVLSLLHSHILQFHNERPAWLWSRIVDIVQTWNQDAGTITPNNLPEDIINEFNVRVPTPIPKHLAQTKNRNEKSKNEHFIEEWKNSTNAHPIALMALVGTWNDDSKSNKDLITQLLGIPYENCIKIARELLNAPNSPLSLKKGIWRVSNRAELLSSLASQLLDHDFDKFKEIALTVLKEQNPAFELAPDTRFSAAIYGKSFNHSEQLCKGIAEGLAIIASNTASYSRARLGKAETTSLWVVRELFAEASWLTWGSLNDLLPALAEAAPAELLEAIERTLKKQPTPFIELYAQETGGIAGRNYMTGLLWALECLAWDERLLVRVCVVLGELAILDPGGNWANRPINSIVTILLPWFPQTLATGAKQQIAVETLLKECPDIAWDVLLKLLPDSCSFSSGTYKPKWRQKIPADWEKKVTDKGYEQQVSVYANLAVEEAKSKMERLVQLAENLDKLSNSALKKFLSLLATPSITSLPESEYAYLWKNLITFTKKHKRFHDAEWALPAKTIQDIEAVAALLSPSNLFDKYKILFDDRDFDLFDDRENFKDQQIQLEEKRVAALQEIYNGYDTSGLLRFAQLAVNKRKLGHSLGTMGTEKIDHALLPSLLNSEDNKQKKFVSYFVSRRQRIGGWEWCDGLDKTSWDIPQTAFFLSSLPSSPETWTRVTQWLGVHENSYWSQVFVNYYEAKTDITYAVKKLIDCGRPNAAIDCLSLMLTDDISNMPLDLNAVRLSSQA